MKMILDKNSFPIMHMIFILHKLDLNVHAHAIPQMFFVMFQMRQRGFVINIKIQNWLFQNLTLLMNAFSCPRILGRKLPGQGGLAHYSLISLLCIQIRNCFSSKRCTSCFIAEEANRRGRRVATILSAESAFWDAQQLRAATPKRCGCKVVNFEDGSTSSRKHISYK